MATKRVRISTKPFDNPRAEAWVKHRGGEEARAPLKTELYTARLTIDVSSALRARIKVAAFQRGATVAEVIRELLEKAFPETQSEVRS